MSRSVRPHSPTAPSKRPSPRGCAAAVRSTAMGRASACLVLLVGCATAPPEQRMAVDGVDLPYRVQGAGETVVLVHGCCVDQRSWDPHVAALAIHYRVVTFDQRYWGPAPWPDDGRRFSVQTQIDDLATFVRGLDAGPVHLVGWSMSGASVLGMALRHPEQVRSLFLYEPSVASTITDPVEAKAAAASRTAMFGPVLPLVKAGDPALALRQMMESIDGRPGAFDALPAAFRAIQLANARTLPLMFAAPAPPRIGCEQLAALKVPARVVRGEQTQAFYRIAADATARCLGGVQAEVVPAARHLWPAQDPQAFAATVSGWLAHR